MAEPFIFINSYKLKPGKAQEYTEAFQEVVDIVEAKEPEMLYFAHHVSEDGAEATTVQVHADANNMAFHMELVAAQIRRAMEQYLDPSSMTIRIYGTPPDALIDQMRQVAGTGVSVNIAKPVVGFNRFREV
jgi:quinol monooxygenase YgiN